MARLASKGDFQGGKAGLGKKSSFTLFISLLAAALDHRYILPKDFTFAGTFPYHLFVPSPLLHGSLCYLPPIRRHRMNPCT